MSLCSTLISWIGEFVVLFFWCQEQVFPVALSPNVPSRNSIIIFIQVTFISFQIASHSVTCLMSLHSRGAGRKGAMSSPTPPDFMDNYTRQDNRSTNRQPICSGSSIFLDLPLPLHGGFTLSIIANSFMLFWFIEVVQVLCLEFNYLWCNLLFVCYLLTYTICLGNCNLTLSVSLPCYCLVGLFSIHLEN